MKRERQPVKEEDGTHKQWYEDAKKQTIETLPEFLRHLTEDYAHDYGTICHAIAAAMDAAGRAVDRSPVGGITGFQASCIAWEIIKQWTMLGDGPARIQSFENLLYPQYEHKFRCISAETWTWAQNEARKKLADGEHLHPDVRAHMQRVADGLIPFGLSLEH